MTLWEALILGVVQGATEFLPVSSSGHLVMAQTILDIEVPGVLFEVAVHVATLLSVLVAYRTRVQELVRGLFTRSADAWGYLGLVMLATLPAGLLGVLAKDRIEALFENPLAPGVALIVTGLILWSSRGPLTRAAKSRPGWTAALLIGLAQALALVPGISRSGSTVVMALWLGIQAEEAAAFAFLMAVPAIGGAALLQILDMHGAPALGAAPLLVGGVAAAVTGVLAIRMFIKMLANRSFHLFAPYCWAAGSAFLIFVLVR